MNLGINRFLAGLALAFVLLIFLTSNAIPWLEKTTSFPQLTVFNRFVIDALFVCAFCILFYTRHIIIRAIAYCVGVFGLICIYVQYSSIDYSGAFFPLVALENAQHANLIGNSGAFYGLFAVLVYCIGLIIFAERGDPSTKIFQRLIAIAVLLGCAIALKNDYKWLPQGTINDRATTYRNGVVGFEKKSPMGEIVGVVYKWLWDGKRLEKLANNGFKLSNKENEFAFKHKLS